MPKLARPAIIGTALVVLYIGGALWGREFETLPGLTPWYPPPGIALVFLLLFGVRYAPAALVAEVITGLWVFKVGSDFNAFQIVVNSVALTGVYAGAAFALRHLVSFDPRLPSTRDLLWLVGIGAVIAPILAGAAGIGVRIWADATDAADFVQSVRTWATGDGLGIVSIAPALLAARAARIAGTHMHPPSLQSVAQVGALLAAPILAVVLNEDRVALLFAAVLPTAWIALTRTYPTTAAAVLLANSATTIVISQASLSTSEANDVQLFMLVNAVLALMIGDRVRSLRAARAKLAFDATHDSLTDLANRRAFLDHTGAALGAGQEVAVLFFDLDRFKHINDASGHVAGDEVLLEAARRLRSELDPSHLIARFGGDEFSVLLEGPGAAAISTTIAGRIVACLSQPFDRAGRNVVMGASVGIALSDADVDPHRLLGRADVAMYEAKRRGGAGYAVFDNEMARAAERRTNLELQMRAAIDEDQFELAFQPILDLRGGEARTLEALSRWEMAGGEAIDPEEFIALAEEIGLIVPLGHYVLEKACRAAAGWAVADGGSPPAVSVNVSGIQLRSEPFAADVSALLTEVGLPPERLILELTESVLLDDFDDALASLERLHETGIQLALDDFGKGFSSFSYLGRLPIDIVKIDRQFMLDAEERGPVVLAAIVDLAHELGLKAVVEGVETQEQLDLVRSIGSDGAQGYLIGRPGTAADVLEPSA